MELSIAISSHPYTDRIRSGEVKPEGIELRTIDVKPQIAAFRRMTRDREFDICELAMPTYMAAREAGGQFMALPIPLQRHFHHGDMVCRPGSGITGPKDLEGRKAGVRAYTVTTGVWARGILSDEYGLDVDAVTWLTDDEEHVSTLVLPPNVRHVDEGESLVQLFKDGGIDAAMGGAAGLGRSGAPTEGWDKGIQERPQEAYPIVTNPEVARKDFFERTGIYPSHGVLALKSELLEENPWIAKSLFDVFSQEKQRFLEMLDDTSNTEPDVLRYREYAGVVSGDPLPYGLEENRASFEALARYSHEQHILKSIPTLEEIFFPVA